MSTAHYAVNGETAVITLDNPPVNGLGHELRSGIVAGLERAAADPRVKAVVLIGSPKAFSGGADIREFNTPKMTAEPNLHNVIRAIEASAKPVRSEERRVGKECRARWSADQINKNEAHNIGDLPSNSARVQG